MIWNINEFHYLGIVSNMITFKELGLQEEILTAIEKMGFVNPSPIQEKAIPQILSSDQDVIALAQTGTGKTAAFGLRF